MAEPPSPKRQRLSEPDGKRSQPTTPTRASYQSPTKASLARSHPNLLARSPGRERNSGAYSRGRNLRMSLLANRTVSLDGEAGASIPMLQSAKRDTNTAPEASVAIASDGKEGFSAAIAQAFTENRPRTSTYIRSPLTSRQPSATSHSRNDARSPSPAKEATPSFMRPKLVPRPYSSASSTGHASSEPDLPPTPVQLGLEPPADRPRGLISSSSSPRGSKSNSGQRRKRHRGSPLATSSPSKLREHRAQLIQPASRLRQQSPVEEAPESDIRQPDVQEGQDELPEGIKQKQATIKALQAELAQLKADMRRLELMASQEEQNITPRTLKALTTTRIKSRSGSPDIVLPEMITMPADAIPHLTLFAPAGLRLKTSTKTIKAGVELRQVHTIGINAPAPYPPHLFGATIDVRTDPQTSQIECIEPVRWNGTSAISHGTLRMWAAARRGSSLHCRDVSGLIWGMGSYWEFCEKRAKVWNTLLTGKLSDEESRPEELVRWLGKQSIEISVDGDISIVLSSTARLDWTGRVEESVGIACKGVPARAHQMVARVFDGLRRKRGIIRAVEGVMKMLQDA